MSPQTTQLDLITLVDEQDRVIGEMDKIAAHLGEGKLHRAVSVLLFRNNLDSREFELLIQQRSHKKIVGAEQWANTVCGNVWPSESYEACARRRLKFELGISADIELVDAYVFRYKVQCNSQFSENEIDHMFVGWFDGEVNPNPDEVTDYEWVAWEEVVKQVSQEENRDKHWAPWLELMIQDEELVETIDSQASLLKA